jgi:predicted Zn finger-like uncharacterized protein
VLIRCEKCSTLYELDDKLLPPQGAPVQCSKCQFVFKAYPAPPQPSTLERAANDAPAESSPQPQEQLERPPARRDEVVREGGALAHSFDRPASRPMTAKSRTDPDADAAPSAPSPDTPVGMAASRHGRADDDGPKFTPDGRPIRKVPFPAADPPKTGPRMPPIRDAAPKTPGSSGGVIRWVIVAVVVLAVIVAAAAAWFALRPAPAVRPAGAPTGQSRAVPQGGTPEPPARN